MRGENIFSVSILFFILLFFSKEEEECCQTEKKRDSIDVQEWGGAAQLVTPITVSQRDVFFSPHQKEAEEPSDLLLFFFFFFSTFFLCISWLSLLPTYLYLGLWWKMRGCSTCCHPTSASHLPPTASPTTNNFFFFFIISTADGGRLCGTFRAHLFTTFSFFFFRIFIFLLSWILSTHQSLLQCVWTVRFPWANPLLALPQSSKSFFRHFSLFIYLFIF